MLMSDFDYNVFGSDVYNDIAVTAANNTAGLISLDYQRLKADTGIERFKFEVSGPDHEGYLFDFLPFPVTKKHPKYKQLVKLFNGNPPMDWQLSMFLHTAKTPGGSYKFLCPTKNYGLPCPVCEQKARLFESGGEWKTNPYQKEIKELNDTQRDYFLVRNREDGKVYVMEYSTFLFGDHLRNKLARSHRGKSNIILANPNNNGHSLRFWVDAGTIKDTRGNLVIGHINEIEFEERNEAIDSEILQSLPALDDYLHLYSYDEITAIMDGTFFAEVEESEGEVEYTPVHTTPVAENDTPVVHRRRPPSEETPVPEEHVRPSRRMPEESVAIPPTQPDSREARRAARRKAEEPVVPDCPAGGTFGVDLDRFPECDNCILYEKCETRYEDLKDLATL